MDIEKEIWFNSEDKNFFLIPVDIQVSKGEYRIEQFDKNEKFLAKKELIPFLAIEKNILEKLKTDYKQAIEKTKESLVYLNQFAFMTGQITEESIKNIIKTEFDSLKENEQEPFVMGKELVQELIKNVKKTDLNEEESKEAFKSTFQKVPEILSYFEENKLSEAANDPEAWANEMYQKMYGNIDQKRKSMEKNNLKNEIKESIAKGLRDAGIAPIDE